LGNALNLKKLFLAEIAAVIIVIVIVVIFVEITPYLAASNQGQIGVYNQRVYAQKTVTLQAGQVASIRFNYSTYDPAILVVNLKFQDWQKPGNLSVYCNGILIDTFSAQPSSPEVKSTTVTFSGYDLVKPPSAKLGIIYQYDYGNEITFMSPFQTGFEGTFNYQISIRGSR
jgi:hypothetical protein